MRYAWQICAIDLLARSASRSILLRLIWLEELTCLLSCRSFNPPTKWTSLCLLIPISFQYWFTKWKRFVRSHPPSYVTVWVFFSSSEHSIGVIVLGSILILNDPSPRICCIIWARRSEFETHRRLSSPIDRSFVDWPKASVPSWTIAFGSLMIISKRYSNSWIIVIRTGWNPPKTNNSACEKSSRRKLLDIYSRVHRWKISFSMVCRDKGGKWAADSMASSMNAIVGPINGHACWSLSFRLMIAIGMIWH